MLAGNGADGCVPRLGRGLAPAYLYSYEQEASLIRLFEISCR